MNRIIYSSLVIMLTLLWSLELSAQYNWSHSGPDGLGNRTRSIIFDAQGNLLAGAGGGSLWRSTNRGVSWNKVQSYTGSPAITSMVRNGQNIYVATGELEFFDFLIAGKTEYDPTSAEGFFGYMGTPGQGVFVSKDNGVTWSNDNATTTQFPTLQYDGPFIGTQKLVMDDQQRLFMATRSGLYYSDSEDINSITKANGSDVFMNSTIYDVEVSKGVVFAGTSDSLYISRNRGKDFIATIVTPRVLSFLRVEIEVAPSNADVIYVAGSRNSSVSQLNGIWRSDDLGISWTQYAPQGGPGFSPLGNTARDAFTMRVEPDDEDAVIIAGNAWFTFDGDAGWTQTASHFNPTSDNYIPTPIYTVLFDPNDPNAYFVGTGTRITYSPDNGETFFQRSKGYGASQHYSIGSVGVLGQESIISGTPTNGTVLNNNFWKAPYDPDSNPSGSPSVKGFGDIFSANNSQVSTSNLYAGSVLIQGTDGGVMRSAGTFAASFERFYGPPLNSDTLERPSTGERDSVVAAPLSGISGGSIFIDRSGADQDPGGMVDNGKMSPQMQFELGELLRPGQYAPAGITDLDELKKYPGKDSLQNLDHYLFYASSRYLWICNFALGNRDGLTPRWDRITNNITALSGDEYFTSMAVTNDGQYTVFVGTSQGRIWRIRGATNFDTYDGTTGGVNVSDIITNIQGPVTAMAGRWISDIAIDPSDPSRVAVTFAGYGGPNPPSYVWLIENALTSPRYSFFALAPKEPAYTCEFVQYQPDPNSSNKEVALFIGTESGMYSTRDISPAGAWVDELPSSYGNAPIYDIHARRFKIVVTNEEDNDYVIQEDNSLFAASLGYGTWFTNDAQFTAREGEGENPIEEIDAYASKLYPNPSNSTTNVEVDLPETGQVLINLYTLDGKKLAVVANEQATEGRHVYEFDTRGFNPGMYLVEVTVEGETQNHQKTMKAVITR